MFVPGSDRLFATASDTVYLWDQSACTRLNGDDTGRTMLRTPYDRQKSDSDDVRVFEDFVDNNPPAAPIALP